MRSLAVTLGWALRLAITVAWLLAPAIGAQSSPLTKGPYLTVAGPGAITVHYETDEAGEGVVRFGAGGGMERTIPAVLHERVEYKAKMPSTSEGPTSAVAYLYRARLTALAPGTQYRYEVVPAPGGASSGVRTFRSLPQTTDRITFIGYGDTRANPKTHRALAASFARYAPLFVLHNGDMVDSGDAYAQWGPQFFSPLADVIDHIPLMPALGNHEDRAQNLVRLFDTPGGKTWYSFDCGPVHAVVLDNIIHTEAVLKWLEEDLAASKAPWKIVTCHAPTFSYHGHHRSDFGRTDYLPILEKSGVDLVIAGHQHLYERFQPLARTRSPQQGAGGGEPRPITFVISGAGGATFAGSEKGPDQPVDFVAKSALEYEYCLFTADRDTLTMKTLTPEGKEIDNLTITKTNGRYDKAYLAQAKSMEQTMLSLGAVPRGNPMAVVESLPTASKPSPLTLTFRCSGLPEPVVVEARLAPASNQAYAMEPRTTEIKPGSRVESDLILNVRALREITVRKREKDEVLSPELRLIVTARCMGVQASYEVGPVVHGSSARHR